MSAATATAPDTEVLDRARFAAWADQALPALGQGPLRADILAGGSSNIVMRIERGGEAMVVRRPPRTPRPDSLKIIAREARLLAALNGTDVPHPHLYAYCEDPAVIGVPFYVMGFVEGVPGHPFEPLPAPYDRPGGPRRQMAFALVDGIAALANVDYKAIGLDDFGKPAGFLERQVERWRSQLESYRETEAYEPRDIPGLAYAADWLSANTPEMSPPGLIHGDYSFANALFQLGKRPRLMAMIDWELGTVADPLLDLGWVLYAFNGAGQKTPPSGYFDPTGFPEREELAAYYAARTGRRVDNLGYYMILAQYKLAVIMERHYARSLNGRQTPEMGEVSRNFVLRLAAKAAEMAREFG